MEVIATASPGRPASSLDVGASVVLYDDEDLEPCSEAGARLGLPSVVGELLRAETGAQRRQRLREMLRAIGFEWLAYGTVAGGRTGVMPRTFFTSCAHAEWVEHYFRERYFDADPRHHDAPASSLPLAWDLRDIEARSRERELSLHTRRFLDDFHASGIRSGLFFSIASLERPRERTVISLLSSQPDRRWIADSVLGQGLTLGLSVHEFLSSHVRLRGVVAPKPELSALQREILDCLINGQSDKQIAHDLSLSPHTVDYHLRQLRRRFSARNRVQLVHAAIESTGGDPAPMAA